MKATLVCLCSIVGVALSAYAPDKITSLPGANFNITFDQYSGYLSGSDDDNIQLFYWLVESQGNPATDPLVLWLNGGPGCSSVDGLIEENGPFLINPDGVTLRQNPYAWNMIANVLYLESPACVGNSYAKDGNCKINDDGTAQENLHGLEDFFVKFSEYQGRDFYITGESYGGVYIPTLTRAILESQSSIKDNFIGIAIGNGILSYQLNYNSLVSFAYGHGQVSQQLFYKLNKECCNDNITDCDYLESKNPFCLQHLLEAFLDMNNPDLDQYYIYGPCYHAPNSTSNSAKLKRENANEMMYKAFFQKFGYSTAKEGMQAIVQDEGIPCENVTAAETYMNQPAVKSALHVSTNAPAEWQVCSNIPYTTQYYSTKRVFHDIFNLAELRILFYHGDVDAVCNFLGGEQFVKELGLSSIGDWKSWFIGDSQQIGGWWQTYQNNLHFTTVRGSGHEVPEYRPAAALTMLNAFLGNDATKAV